MITERHIQALWYDTSLRPQRLFTHRGQEVRVIDPGIWNMEMGPDFKNAILEVGESRQRIVGDVEVHLRARDWSAHSHCDNPLYRNVVAHVTWYQGAPPASLPPKTISISLQKLLSAKQSFSFEQVDLQAYPYSQLQSFRSRCERVLLNDSRDMHEFLYHFGAKRLWAKAARIGGRMGDIERDQLFYEEIMAALGYKRNVSVFRQIAESIPLKLYRQNEEEAAKRLRLAISRMHWNRSGVRPFNSPEVRLLAAWRLFRGVAVMKLLEEGDFSVMACERMIGVLMRDGTMGSGRAAAVLTNVVVPFALAEERIREVPRWLPPEDISTPVRLMGWRMFGRDHNPSMWYATNGVLIQALLEIGKNYCGKGWPECEKCPLLNEIMV